MDARSVLVLLCLSQVVYGFDLSNHQEFVAKSLVR